MSSIFQGWKEQKARFDIFSVNAQKFITSNLLFGLFSPFYLIFSNTFIFSSSKGNLEMNLVYCIFTFIGIITGFLLNGYISRYVHIKLILIGGVWLIFLTIVLMFSLPQKDISWFGIIFYGMFTGLGVGIYWSSRNYLTLVITNKNNRDFFSGIDFILISLGRVVTPFLIGIYIGQGIKLGWFSAAIAYRSTLILAFALVLVITILILRIKHKSVRFGKFLYFSYSKRWQKVRLLLMTLGFFQGAIYVIPTVFIMKFVGGESFVGTINSLGYLVAIIIVYLISRKSGTEHRTRIVILGFWMLTSGAVAFSLFFKSNVILGTYILIFLMFLAEPILNFPIRASLLDVINGIKKQEKRKGYAYIFDVEAFTAVGRVASLTIFYLLYLVLPVAISIIVFILFMAITQYYCIALTRKINEC
jgi:MFS transporter, YQGE family, putative transporter